jgi:flagellar biosynthesis/type III secretory pathway protein FliH
MTTLQIKLERPLVGAEIVSPGDLDARPTQPAQSALSSATTNQVETDQLIKSIQAAVESVQSQSQHSKQQLAAASVQIASIVMQRVIGNNETLAADRLEQLILEALDRPDAPVSLQLNPQDVSIVEPMIEKIGLPTNQLELKEDQTVPKGECRFNYDGYALTSNLAKQLESIEDRLLEVIND